MAFRLLDGRAAEVVFSERAFLSLLCEVEEKAPLETGGLLLGAWRDDVFYVVEAIDPGPRATHQIAYFEYDQSYTEHLINKVARLYVSRLELVGLWHRHPGSYDRFSGVDDETNATYARMSSHGAISGLVNIDPSFRLSLFHVDSACRYRRISYEVGDDKIPADLRLLKGCDALQASLVDCGEEQVKAVEVSISDVMDRLLPGLVQLKTADAVAADSHAGIEERFNALIDAVIADITFLTDELGIRLTALRRANTLVIEQEGRTNGGKVFFGCLDDGMFLEYGGKRYQYAPNLLRQLVESSPSGQEDDGSEAGDEFDVLENDPDESPSKSILGGLSAFARVRRKR